MVLNDHLPRLILVLILCITLVLTVTSIIPQASYAAFTPTEVDRSYMQWASTTKDNEMYIIDVNSPAGNPVPQNENPLATLSTDSPDISFVANPAGTYRMFTVYEYTPYCTAFTTFNLGLRNTGGAGDIEVAVIAGDMDDSETFFVESNSLYHLIVVTIGSSCSGYSWLCQISSQDANYNYDMDFGIGKPSAISSIRLVRHHLGDFDRNEEIGLYDFVEFAGAFGSCTGDPNYNPAGDFDDDGCIELYDFVEFAGVFGTCY